MKQVDESFHGRQVTVRVGDLLRVTLRENASTGYRWSIPPEGQRALESTVRVKQQTLEAPNGPPGAPGKRHIIFEAIRAGAAKLELRYTRPWEKDTPPAQTFQLRILVRGPKGD